VSLSIDIDLFDVQQVRGQQAMLALSSRPWLGYIDAGRFILAPLSYELLEYASSFASEQCPEGIVAIAQSSLRIVTVERLGEAFNQTSCKLRCVGGAKYNIHSAQISSLDKVFMHSPDSSHDAESIHVVFPLRKFCMLQQSVFNFELNCFSGTRRASSACSLPPLAPPPASPPPS
jgi:hypothetical protein